MYISLRRRNVITNQTNANQAKPLFSQTNVTQVLHLLPYMELFVICF